MRHSDSVQALQASVAWRAPFGAGPVAHYRATCAAGETVLGIVLNVPDLPRDFLKRGIVRVNDCEVPREHWNVVRIKAPRDYLPIAVTLHYPLGGGGGGGGQSTAKSVGSLVAALALVVVTGGIASGAAAPLFGSSFAAGTFGAQALAAAAGLGGALALSALSPPPSVAAIGSAGQSGPAASDNLDQKAAAAASGNMLQPGGPIPRVIGTRKVFPPLIGEAIVELVGEDEYVEAAFSLNGRHRWDDIRIADVSVADAEDVEYETRRGIAGEPPLTLFARQGRTITPQITLSIHQVDSDNQANLADPETPEDDLPVWHRVSTRNMPDEVWLHLLMASGLSINGSTSTDVVVPLRIRIRQRGESNWINLPEIHLSDSTLQQRRRALILKWQAAPDLSSIFPPAKSGFIYANINVPGQVTAPATTGWDADSYFIGASGSDYLNQAVVGSSKVSNIAMFDNRVEVYLDPDVFARGLYEIEILRGAAFLASSFTASSYSYGGVKDFFTYAGTGTPAIPMARTNLADTIHLVRVISIWNEYPVKAHGGIALLAVRARNREVQQVSALASGEVRDWDGSSWSNWTTTSNPAPHYRDILSGAENNDPLPDDLRDDASLLAWRTVCEANGWTCNAIIDDFRTQDALALLAACAYAKPYQSEIYGVTVDKDRSGDIPCQVFSRRNAANVRFERAFARVPDGFIVNYGDAAADYDTTQTIVYQRDRTLATTGLLETITYDGLVDEAAIRARALFDLDQANLRSTFYYCDTDPESLVCRRGDLVALQHDVLTSRAGDGYVKSKTLSGSPASISELVLDSVIPITNEPDMHAVTDMHAIADMHEVGVVTGIAIRRTDNTVSTHALANATGESDTLTLATPIVDDGTIESLADNDNNSASLVVAGALTQEYLRLLVAGINPTRDMQATLTLVDEAPALERYVA